MMVIAGRRRRTQADRSSEMQATLIDAAIRTLHDWIKKAEINSGQRAGVPTQMAEKLKALERENRELRQANEILRKASAYFAMAELDRRSKP